MSHDLFTCPTCGESYDPDGSEHDCPGSRREQMERIDRLENDLIAMRRNYQSLLRAIGRSNDFDRLKLIVEVEELLMEMEQT
jgi:hypothetical protein